MEVYGFIPLLITLVMNYTTGHRVFTKDGKNLSLFSSHIKNMLLEKD
jgi:hypothetical protein